jgi:hypothetical protein
MAVSVRIGKRLCEQLVKQPPEAREVLWDDDLAGFGLRRNTGGTLTFILKYRLKGSPAQRMHVIGSYPGMYPDKARDRAIAIRTAAQLGRDLFAEEAAEREVQALEQARAGLLSRPVSELLDAWRTHTEGEIAKKAERQRSALYEREMLRIEASTLRPAIGNLAIGDLTPERLQALVNTEARRSPSGARSREMP